MGKNVLNSIVASAVKVRSYGHPFSVGLNKLLANQLYFNTSEGFQTKGVAMRRGKMHITYYLSYLEIN